jgi:hypothetical protein
LARSTEISFSFGPVPRRLLRHSSFLPFYMFKTVLFVSSYSIIHWECSENIPNLTIIWRGYFTKYLRAYHKLRKITAEFRAEYLKNESRVFSGIKQLRDRRGEGRPTTRRPTR